MILGYARVSTTRQELDGQVQRLESAGATTIFTDVMSGKRFDRPGLGEMMTFAREGDTLCVVRLDRLGRSMRELLDIVDHLKTRKVDFRSLEEQLDTTTAAGSLIFHVFAALTDFERRLIAERTRDGLAVAMAKGNMPGPPPSGWLVRAMSTLISVSGNIALCKISRLRIQRNLKKPRSPNEGGWGQERGSFPRHMVQRGEDKRRSGSLAFSMLRCSDAMPALTQTAFIACLVCT